MRQMVQARFSFGSDNLQQPIILHVTNFLYNRMYPNLLTVILNMCSIAGFTIISMIVGGQCLAAVSGGSLSINVGIVIVAIISMFIAFGGFNILHTYERWAWIPAVLALLICTGLGGNKLHLQAPTESPAVTTVFSFISLIAGYMLPFASTVGDFAVYMPPNSPK